MNDNFDFISFDDVTDKEDEFGFVSYDAKPKMEPQQQSQEISKKLSPTEEIFSLEEQPEETREIERNQARMTSRGLESVIGLPGDIHTFTKSLFGDSSESILPTSQKLQKFSEEASLGYTKPKNEFEENADEFTKDISTMMLPGSATYGVFRNIGIPIVSELAKEGIKKYGGSEGVGDAVKFGLMLGLDLITQRKAISGKNPFQAGGSKGYAASLIEEGKKLIPEEASLQAKNLEKNLSVLKETLQEGGSRPSTKDALDKISEIQKEIIDGRIPVKKLYPFRQSINEIVESFGGYEYNKLPAKIKERAVKNLQEVKGNVIKGVQEWAEKENPEMAKLWKAGNEAYAVSEKSNKISNFIDKKMGSALKSNIAKTLLGITLTSSGSALSYVSPALGGAGTAAALTAYQTFKILYRVSKSPTLAKYYGKILTGALSGNIGEVRKFDKKLAEEEKKEDVFED